ncbi:hypothetical protein NDU88_004297, partial [Pleurodeles waltl]
ENLREPNRARGRKSSAAWLENDLSPSRRWCWGRCLYHHCPLVLVSREAHAEKRSII